MLKKFLPLGMAGLLVGCVAVTERVPVRLSPKEISSIQTGVKDILVDPESASFKNIRAEDRTLANGAVERKFCGQVNAKNRMGGYSGFAHFTGFLTSAGVKVSVLDNPTDSIPVAESLCSSVQ